MRIQHVKINGFGLFRDFSINNLSPGLNIIIGENEAGKSTCLEFIRTCLFGYPIGKGSRTKPKHPIPAGSKGGGELTLSLENGTVWTLFWQPKSKAGLHKLFELNEEKFTPIDIKEYQHLIENTSREFFEAVYGFSLEQLQTLNSLKDDARVSDLLYGAGMGLGNISLPLVLLELREKQMDGIWLERGQKPLLNGLISKLTDLEQKISAKQEHWSRYSALQAELAAHKEQSHCYEKELQTRMDNINLLKELIRLKTQLADYSVLETSYSKLCDCQITPGATRLFMEKSLESILNQEEIKQKLQSKLNQISTEQTEIIERLSSSTANPIINTYKDEIKSLQEQKGQYQVLIEEKKAIILQLQTITTDLFVQQLFPPETPINSTELEEQASRLKNAWRELSRLMSAWRILSQEYTANGINKQNSGFKTRRFSIGNPAIFALLFGASAALTVLIYNSAGLQWLWAISGLFLCGLMMLLVKSIKNKKFTKIQADYIQKSEELLLKIKPCAIELKELLAHFSINLPDMNAHAQAWAVAIEELVPEVVLKIEHSLALLDELPGLITKLQETEKRISILDKASKNVLLKIEHTAPDIKQNQSNQNSFIADLDKLTAWLNKALTEQMLDEKLKGQLEQLAKQQQETINQLKNSEEVCARHLEQAGVNSLEALKNLYHTWTEQKELKQELNISKQKIETATEDLLHLERQAENILPQEVNNSTALIQWLQTTSDDALNAALTENNHLLSQNLAKQQELAAKTGALQQEANSLLSESELAAMTLERESLLEEARQLARKWSVAALTKYFLEKAKRQYESEHQTAVMQKASFIFSKITNYSYKGLDPAGDENSFAVLSNEGESRLPQELSRGTSEQLYLALRLAVIEHRSQSAEPLPIILDDALVNFDPRRLRNAMDAILALATNHQILYFTCQPHIGHEFIAQADKLGIFGKQYSLQKGIITPA